MNRIGGWIASLLLLGMGGVTLASRVPEAKAAGFTFEPAMLQGEPAPGTEPGSTFGPLNGLYFPPVPTIDDQGRLSFAATLEGPAITSSNRTGLWSGNPGDAALIARAGMQAPGIAQGGAFASFPFDFALFAPVGGSGDLRFSATLGGGGITSAQDEGLWGHADGVTTLLACEGSAAPGPAGIVFTSPLSLKTDQDGHALVIGSVNGTGVSTNNNEGFWTDRSGTLSLLLREGDPVPGAAPGEVIGGAGQFIGTGYTFLSTTWSEDSKLAVVTTLTGPNVTTFDNEILLVERPGGHTILAREGEHAPGFGGGMTFGGNSVLADFGMLTTNQLGQTAFTARVAGNNSTTYPIYSDHTGSLEPLARTGDPAPGTEQTFGILSTPVLSDGGRIAFRAALSGAGSWPPLGLWWDQPGAVGEILPVVIPGDPAPDRPGGTIVAVNFIHGFNAAGQMVFEAVLEDAGGSHTALLSADPTGDLDVVVATGDVMNAHGHPGDGLDPREVSAVSFGGLNASGTMAIRLEFSDGTVGFYAVSRAATSVGGAAPVEGLRLAQNVPNPFASSTRLEFSLAEPARVGVSVFDTSGRLVSRLLDEHRAAGRQALVWDGRDRSGTPVSSGVYWARVEAGETARTVRMVLVRE